MWKAYHEKRNTLTLKVGLPSTIDLNGFPQIFPHTVGHYVQTSEAFLLNLRKIFEKRERFRFSYNLNYSNISSTRRRKKLLKTQKEDFQQKFLYEYMCK